MVKTLNLTFDNGQFRMLASARDLTDAKSWEAFILRIAKEWREAEMRNMN